MPLFFMISGAVFAFCLDKGKYQKRFNFIINKVKRLIIPYILFGFFYVAPIMTVFHFTSMNLKDYLVKGILLSRDSRHLWFILTLFWISLMAICVKALYQKKYGLYALMIVSVTLCLFSKNIISDLRLQSAAYYQLFFFIGMIINKFYEKIEQSLPYKPIISIFIGFVLLLQFYWNTFHAQILYGILGSFMVLLLSMNYSNLKIWTHTLTLKLMKSSYGIYFFHPMIIYVLYYYLYKKEITPVVLCTGIFLISFIASYFLTGLIRKLKIGFVIGE